METVFWVLLLVGQAPAAAALWLTSLPMKAQDILGPALRALLRPGTSGRAATSHRRVASRVGGKPRACGQRFVPSRPAGDGLEAPGGGRT
jgi:hypothetical protein